MFRNYTEPGWVKVKATFDGVEYRGSLANMGTGCHVLIIVKAIRQQIGKQPGDTVHVTVERDEEPRQLELPEELQSGFAQNPGAQEFFETLSFSRQREFVLWINDAKRAETRQQRIEKTIALLLEHKKLNRRAALRNLFINKPALLCERPVLLPNCAGQ